jgi:hypothetical protein
VRLRMHAPVAGRLRMPLLLCMLLHAPTYVCCRYACWWQARGDRLRLRSLSVLANENT